MVQQVVDLSFLKGNGNNFLNGLYEKLVNKIPKSVSERICVP